jgi:DNA repair protein RecN (Recombination protein N)
VAEEAIAAISDFDEDTDKSLNEIESRLDKLSKLKRKYGLTIKDVLEYGEKIQQELDELRNCESTLSALKIKEKASYDEALVLARALSDERRKKALVLDKKIKETLEFLDMPKVVFYTNVEEIADEKGRPILSENGINNGIFYMSANEGLDPQPLSKIASGGELSRVMLAVKSVLAAKEDTQGLIFDEIDSGVSGKTARKIGLKMKELSKNVQIITVTHSAQIASLADRHYLISKSNEGGVTTSSVESLDYDGRIKELSRILGGLKVSESQRKAAIDMLQEKEL